MVSGNSCDLVLAFSVGLLNDSRSLSNTSEPPSCYKPSKLNFPKKKCFFCYFFNDLGAHKSSEKNFVSFLSFKFSGNVADMWIINFLV